MSNQTASPSFIRRLLSLEPAVIRGAVVAVTGVIALVIGRSVDVSWVDGVLNAYAALSPLVAAFLIRPAVTANDKVVVYLDDPADKTSITSGPAIYKDEAGQNGRILQEASETTNYGRHAA